MYGMPNYLAYFCVFVVIVIILFNVHLFIVKLVKISFHYLLLVFLYSGE